MRFKLAAFAALVLFLSLPAAAQTWVAGEVKDDIRVGVRCADGEGVSFVLDFDRTTAGRPLTYSSMIARGQSCVKGDTTYRLDGLPGAYKSPQDIRRVLDALRTLLNAGAPIDEKKFAEALSFVRELDAPRREAAKK